MIFDASSRDNCEVKDKTRVHLLQSLTLMNNPEFIKAANYLSEEFLIKRLLWKIK